MSEPTGTESVEEGQPVTTPESPEPVAPTASAEAEVAYETTTPAADIPAADIPVGDVLAEETPDGDDAGAEELEPAGLAEPEAFGVPALPDRPVQTVGRRKEAVVRVRLVPGAGGFTLNGKSLETYFPNKLHQQLIREPLVTVDKTERFDIFATLHGGGPSGQAGALRLAIARALVEMDSEDRPPLKAAGFLTRDARATERKKYGLKKARKAPQYSKR